VTWFAASQQGAADEDCACAQGLIAEGDLMTSPIWSNVAGENPPVLRGAL
jgi:hypothetical protein